MDTTEELLKQVSQPDAMARLAALIRIAEKEAKVHRDAVLNTPRNTRDWGLARWHYSHACERENALKEAWMVLMGRPF